ncbi:MAG: allantoate amidohydrolase [Chloroflexia bacterium]|nr:allantoate amidohydrolase [Chloroflexia bacterium]
MSTLHDHAATIMRRSDELAAFTTVEGQITRPYGTSALLDARDQLAAWMGEADMSTHVDNVGNLFGRYEADTQSIDPKTFLVGGHFDSVVDAGRYDGTLGILTGIAVVQHLNETGRRFPFAIEVAAFADEEGNRFHTSFLGSSPVAGLWDPAWVTLEDDAGTPLKEAIRALGGDPEAIGSDTIDSGSVLGFIEVHIEQGPVLQDRNLPVAAVSSITGSLRATIEFAGMAGHAGTVPMALRRDALAGAAELVLAVEAVGASETDLVATVGTLECSPGASNVIPGHAHLTLDLRHPDSTIRERAYAGVRAQAEAIAERRSLDLDWTDSPSFAETVCDARLTKTLREAIAGEGIEPLSLFSGAGHDAITMANICPVTMLFVRCRDGISHNPAESIDEVDVEAALRVLERFLFAVAGQR